MALEEVERAAEFRRKMSARADWECAQRDAALPGDAGAAAQTVADWDPVTDLERGWSPAECSDDGEGLQLV